QFVKVALSVPIYDVATVGFLHGMAQNSRLRIYWAERMAINHTNSNSSVASSVDSAIESSVAPPVPHSISFAVALRFWLKLGFISFGGPAGQIAIMHEELVEQRRWISEKRFLHALNYCMLLPGPEAQQLAIYIGWLLHRT